MLGLCVRTIDNLIARGELPCRRIGRRILIPYSALVQFAGRLILALLVISSARGFAQSTPSDTHCDPAIPLYVYNGDVYTCKNGSPQKSATGGSINASPQHSCMYQPNSGSSATAQGDPNCSIDGAGNFDSKRIGRDYDVIAFGAQQCPVDATAAIQAAHDANPGAPVILPPGKWCISAPIMHYTLPPSNGGYAPGLHLLGSGHNVTQLLMLPSFHVPTSLTCPPSAPFPAGCPTNPAPSSSITIYPAPAMIDVQGVVNNFYSYGFQQHGEIADLTMMPYGCESNPSVGEPACAYVNPPVWATPLNGPYDGIQAISLEGAWNYKIHGNTIQYMSGDGILTAYRLDVNADGDLAGSWGSDIWDNQIEFNLGWGINLAGGTSQSQVGDRIGNTVLYNSLGGIRAASGSDVTVAFNSIAFNGCGQPATAANPTSAIWGSSLTSPATCTTNPLGAGILVDREYGSASQGPYNDTFYKNQCDSNVNSCFDIKELTSGNLWSNMNFRHATTYNFNNTFGNQYAPEAPTTPYLLGFISASNLSINNDYQRNDYFANSGYPTRGTDAGNALLDPGTSSVDVGAASTLWANQNTFGSIVVDDYVPFAVGGGEVVGVPALSAPSGGQVTVTSWPVNAQGEGFTGSAPTLTVLGGDSAWQLPTLLTLTQSGGALNGCTVLQGGGPYNRMPLTRVQDTRGGTGSGGTISLTLSGSAGSYTVASCTITAAGSGYSHPAAGVAPVCQTQPVVTATPTIGVARIKVSTPGNYGAWTPGSTAPAATVTLNDPTGTGFTGTPVLWPVNIATGTGTNIVWGMVGVVIEDNQHGYGMQSISSATVTFSTPTCSGCSAATGVVQEAYMLAPSLTVSNAGSCDAGAALWTIVDHTPVGSTNTNLNRIWDQGISVTQPSGGTLTNSVTMDSTHADVNLVRTAGDVIGEYCGTLNSSGLPTAGCIHRIYKANDGTNSQYFEWNTQGTALTGLTQATGSNTPQALSFGTGAGGGSVTIDVGGTGVTTTSSTDFSPSTAGAISYGSVAKPISTLYFGSSGSANMHFAGSFTSNTRVATWPDSSGTVAWTSQLSPVRAGTWTISSSTSVAVTFSPPMSSTPNDCSVTPSASAATTGTPFATSLSTTGFTVNVPTSGTLSGTYNCTLNNSN